MTMQVAMGSGSESGLIPVWDHDGQVWLHPSTDRRGMETFVVRCSGFVKDTGTLLATESNGSVPISHQGSLVTVSTTLKPGFEDLFS